MLRNRIAEARRNSDEGFTLIELLIVIIVLGILAGIVVFGVGTFRADAQTSACEADVKTVNVAATAYDAAEDVPLPRTNVAADLATLEAADYIQDTPTIPGVSFNADQEFQGAC